MVAAPSGPSGNDIRFEGQVAIVTGAGGGLGRTYAVELARRGAAVVVNDLGADPDGTGAASEAAEAVVAEITAAGGTAIANGATVATPEGGEGIVRAALDAYGRVDVVINNAGILRDRSFVNLEPADLDAVVAVHFAGAFHVTRPAFRAMKAQQDGGRLLFTSSTSGLFGNFGQANYGAAKMGLVGLSNVLAIEGAKAGITSNVVAPIARTRLTEGLLGPLGAALDPEYVTPLALLLVSRECDLSGEVFLAGAGWYSRVFVGVTPGWVAEAGGHPSVEDIRDHLDVIRAEDGYAVPPNADQAAAPLMKRLAG